MFNPKDIQYLDTNECLMGIPAVQEHGQLRLLRQLKLLLKVPASNQSNQQVINQTSSQVHL